MHRSRTLFPIAGLTFILLLIAFTGAIAQMSGNAVYGRNRLAHEPSSGVLFANDSVMFVEASVMMNVRADEYVALFGVTEDAPAIDDAMRRIDERIRNFTADLRALGVAQSDMDIDFITQTRVYDFETISSKVLAQERFVGFRVKKNVIVHYREKDRIERILTAAAKWEIHDLIKVDYHVSDPEAIRGRLLQEATKIIKDKGEKYRGLLGIPLGAPMMIQQEKYDIYFPGDMYQSYTASESGKVSGSDKVMVQEMQKSATFYFDALTVDGFDRVINPLVVEPVVQFTLYLKVRYSVKR